LDVAVQGATRREASPVHVEAHVKSKKLAPAGMLDGSPSADAASMPNGTDGTPVLATHSTRDTIMCVTADLRAELDAKGVAHPLPNEELTALSRQFNVWLEEKRMRDDHTMQSTSWFNLWKLLDDDGSNDIEYEYARFPQLRIVCAFPPIFLRHR
jgi:hypothetical protein